MKRGVLVVGQSEIRETKPLGGKDQPDYLNQVVECETDLNPQELLKVCKEVEKEMGREDGEKWESRIIDVDILFYGDQRVHLPGLTIPHPGVKDRDFVVEGLRDLGV